MSEGANPTTPTIQVNGMHNVHPKTHVKEQLRSYIKLITSLFVAYLLVSRLQPHHFGFQYNISGQGPATICEQEQPLRPSNDVTGKVMHILKSDDFAARAAEALGGAIRIPTESFDEWGPVESDPRWANLSLFHTYLEAIFPRTHSSLSLTKINTYGLLYEWKGSDDSLAPLLLMAHQDVVPVDPAAYSLWKEPPYSGKLVDGYVWGRGSVDDKSGLIGILLAVEILLEQGWNPKRTITLSLGFDEETSGLQGASHLARYLQVTQKKKFAMIVDEGGRYNLTFGRMTAAPAIAERGYTDIRIKVNTPGGHSSTPPVHTSIGYLALLLTQLEANPRPIHLTRQSPIFKSIECSAAHSPDIPDRLRREVIRASQGDDTALKKVEQYIQNSDEPNAEWLRSILGTTQAVDMIHGGVKSNALPEEAFAIVNHRIAIDSSIGALKDSVIDLLSPVASKQNLELVGFDNISVSATSSSFRGKITLSYAWGYGLEPAPISSPNSPAYKLLSGTIRAAWEDAHPGDESIIVAPSMMGGNTGSLLHTAPIMLLPEELPHIADTRWYWSLSDNIFRYGHLGAHHSYNGVHTVNEAIRLDGFVDMVKFFSILILNADESEAI
ncbi:hypothetical protein FRC04_010857 [Tulasnella sp. 424]|nr:hypothetical protein FRC04_010857 [Tulasnella sp. 424]KAG8972011.1 hypothetical protein FRC05_010424 [Tulasnella sp. 425]